MTCLFRIQSYNAMDLYRHIAHCHVALQTFLNLYPIYWCFVPMNNNEAANENLNYNNADKPGVLFENSTNENLNLSNMTTDYAMRRDQNTLYWCMLNIPRPPRHYRFSKRQRHEQYEFFKLNLDCSSLVQHADVYQARIVIACNYSFDIIIHFFYSIAC